MILMPLSPSVKHYIFRVHSIYDEIFPQRICRKASFSNSDTIESKRTLSRLANTNSISHGRIFAKEPGDYIKGRFIGHADRDNMLFKRVFIFTCFYGTI